MSFKSLELKIPPLVLVLIAALLMYFSPNPIVFFNLPLEVVYYLTRALCVLSVVIILSGIYCFKKANTTVDPTNPSKSSELVDFGIYKFTRNPMYLGFAVMLLAMAIKMQTLVALLWLLVFVLYMTRFQIKPEEQALNKIFGVAYVDYCQRVRRWV
ncbi:methyltransferase family protein [Thalassomonas sp. M1454]|uniref:methyltransferase family protein n=1 Tax=Thalassomonas sp. M1454 TaxID=2594477 RepID=UPI00117F77CD|nr:isoprenylcysteine carboxylmethyltransferase family protein [Thalassomonas sp. M1454]TRX53969.1 isoprenylcysteine carboxylmethyltransferase family protein [Thalassomonas sp. M1454]